MNQAFLETYHYLIEQNKQPIPAQTQGLWLVQGDEPLMAQWLIDALRPMWRYHQQAVKRIELVSPKSWHEVITELDSLSLFDPASAIIVSGNHKPDKNSISALNDFAKRIKAEQQSNLQGNQQSNQQTTLAEAQNHLVWVTAKVDKKSLSAQWIKPFSTSGYVIDCHIHNENQRLAVLQNHARQFQLNLQQEAWQLLMSHTQNNLLNAYQTLWRLSYLFPQSDADNNTHTAHTVNQEQLQQALVSECTYNIYDLSNAMLTGKSAQVVDIINGMQTINEAPTLVLWSIAKDMRLIQQLQAGKNAQSIGIWRNKEQLYVRAQRRLSTADTQHWSELLFTCDQSIKGIIKQPIWELLLQSALAVSGIKLFYP